MVHWDIPSLGIAIRHPFEALADTIQVFGGFKGLGVLMIVMLFAVIFGVDNGEWAVVYPECRNLTNVTTPATASAP